MNMNLEADVNHQEDEDEEGEAVWLREQGHCKTTSVGGGGVSSVPRLHHWPQRQQAREAIRESHWNACHGGKRGWHGSLGRSEEGAGVGSPEGCFTITVRRHRACM